jgi:HupE / UreJ protein
MRLGACMAQRPRLIGLIGLIGLVTALFLQTAQAHLMVAQRGTLNFVGTGGFVVMALPVDAFRGVDDDGDGLMSMAEMRAHSQDIEAQVQKGLQLMGDTGPRPLEAVMLNLSPDDAAPSAPARHLVVLGRFSIADPAGQPIAPSGLKLRLSLFGKAPDTQQQDITVTRGNETQKMVLAPGREERKVFPSAVAVLLDQASLGAEHALGGLDHMLFLLVVLATGFGWRQIALALSCFTVGHAITLAVTAWGGLQVPASIVEPAIAATIVGMALFDRWSSTRPQPLPSSWRLALVFGCALIHGLGLAGALNLGGLDTQSRLLSLAGFNFGIEAAQLGVAMAACALLAGIRHFRGPSAVALTARLAGVSAVAIGSVWLARRAMLFT